MPMNPRQPSEIDVSSSEEVLSTPEGLRAALAVIDQLGPRGWDALPVARALLDLCQTRFAALSRTWGRPAEDATHAAWLAMRGRSIREAADPWAALSRAVRLSLQAETYAERLLTSSEKARRPAHRAVEAPVRAGEHQDALQAFGASPNEPAADTGAERLVDVTAAFLVVAGWPEATARCLAEYVTARVSDMRSQRSALDVLRRDEIGRLRFGLDQPRWNTLLGLLVGRDAHSQQPAEAGVLARILLGDTLADLLRNTTLLDHARAALAGGSR